MPARWHCAGRGRSTSVPGNPQPLRVVAADAPPIMLGTTSNHGVRVYYNSGWHNAKLHGSINGGPWEDYPLYKVSRQ
jgi:hypothetical protein